MITDKEIRRTVEMAIPLPSCPVKKAHAEVSRVWLEQKIKEYISRAKQSD